MNTLKDSFLKYLSLKKSGSADTKKAYNHDLSLFIKFLEDRDINDFKNVDKIVILDYLSDLKKGNLTNSKISEATYARNLSCLKSFFKYLNTNMNFPDNPCINIKVSSIKKALPNFLTIGEVERLLESCDLSNEIGIRNRMIIELLYATGMRVSELSNIKLIDIDTNSLLIKVTGKGNKERLVPYYDYLNNLLVLYLKEYRNKHLKNDCDFLFINQKGNQLSTRSVEIIVNKQSKEAGLQNKVYPHMLRHSFATHILDNGANLRVVQELLGHENLSTTTIYTHVTVDKLQEVISKKHPHSNKK